jgi:uncharacterized protein with FMN-binding domain
MKKFLLPAVLLIFAGCVSFALTERFSAGAYEGRAEGYYGPIVVLVDTDSSFILNISVLEEDEDEFIGADAIRTLRTQILETGSTDLDAVSGATATSNAFLEAVDNALETARRRKVNTD